MNAAQALLDKHLGFLIRVERKEKIKAAYVLVLTIITVMVFAKFFPLFIDTSELRCLPERVYIGYPKTRDTAVGDIVSFVSTERQTFGIFRGHRLAKIVMAKAGDRVTSNEQGVSINGKFIAVRSEISLQKLKDRKLTPLNMDRVLEPGEIFLMGTMPRSFDSRYWGVIHEQDVDRFVKAIV
jgi:conjugal transfer pilin signal peptidase TrbI